jgi:hypothetical protein
LYGPPIAIIWSKEAERPNYFRIFQEKQKYRPMLLPEKWRKRLQSIGQFYFTNARGVCRRKSKLQQLTRCTLIRFEPSGDACDMTRASARGRRWPVMLWRKVWVAL